MDITKFNNTELTRNRLKDLKLVEANVMISKGNLSGETLPTNFDRFETFLEKFENLGINTKDSPAYNDEDIIEELDYENNIIGIKALGDIVVRRITQLFMTWVSDELRNQEVTLFIVPKNYAAGDQCLFIEGIKLSSKGEGKGNSESSPQRTFSYTRRADKWTDVYKVFEVPEPLTYNLEESTVKEYPVGLASPHGTKYHDGYLWVLMAGNLAQNPVKIDANDLSSYDGVTSNKSITNTEIIYAKGYQWYPNDTSGVPTIGRTDPDNADLDAGTVEFDIGSGSTTGGGMVFDGVNTIIVAMFQGFAIIDITNVDVPVMNYYNTFMVDANFSGMALHSAMTDGTYVYMTCGNMITSESTVLKVKISDPTFAGATGWIYQGYPNIGGFTDDQVIDGDYLYLTHETFNGINDIIKVATSDLSIVDNIGINSPALRSYGIFKHEGLLFITIIAETGNPDQIRIYDMDLVLLHTHELSIGFKSVNEIIFKDVTTMFVTSFTMPMKIMKMNLTLP